MTLESVNMERLNALDRSPARLPVLKFECTSRNLPPIICVFDLRLERL